MAPVPAQMTCPDRFSTVRDPLAEAAGDPFLLSEKGSPPPADPFFVTGGDLYPRAPPPFALWTSLAPSPVRRGWETSASSVDPRAQ